MVWPRSYDVFQKLFSDRAIKESTWRNKYLKEIAKRKHVEEKTMDLKQFPDKKRGWLLLVDEIDRRVQAYILDLQSNGGVINSTIIIAVA